MISWFDITTYIFLNPYYMIPAIFTIIVLVSHWKKGNMNLPSSIISSFEIFSITNSVEYIIIFLITESLPKSLESIDKIILGLSTLVTFLVIFRHTTEGTWIGSRVDNILNKYILTKPVLISMSPFIEELGKLRSLRENIMSGNRTQINNAYQVFLENGSSIVMSLTRIHTANNINITRIQTLYDCCKKDFKDLTDTQIFNIERLTKTAGSVSEFIGVVDGFIKRI